MSFLQLKSITCLKKQDLVGKDEPIINLDGVSVWSGTGFTKGTVRSLENVEPRKFTNQIMLELVEYDRGAPEVLGEKAIDDKPEGVGVSSVEFTRLGASYKITYQVK